MRGNTQNNIKNFSWTEERFEVWDPRDPWLPYKANEEKLYSLCFYFKNKGYKTMHEEAECKEVIYKKIYYSYIKILFTTWNDRRPWSNVHGVLMKNGCETRK